MSKLLRNLMAEIESWESATEFGISESEWADYQVKKRSDDLYIALISMIFDQLNGRVDSASSVPLIDLAKALLVYSKSTAAKYITGVERDLNLLYCASVFYIAGYSATATYLVGYISKTDSLSEEEQIIVNFLNRDLDIDGTWYEKLNSHLEYSNPNALDELLLEFQANKKRGLETDPRLFIASSFMAEIISQFKKQSLVTTLVRNSSGFNYEKWAPLLSNHGSTFKLWELFPSQIKMLDSGVLYTENTIYSMQMPTSSGKTSLTEIIIYNEVKILNRRVLFLVPFRALASEIAIGITKRLSAAQVRVVASYGGNLPTKVQGLTLEDSDVLIITPEKFIALSQFEPGIGSGFDTIICDEGHLIDDNNRGFQYELLLTRLIKAENASKKVIFMSAILPNVNDIHKWLGGSSRTLVESHYKPVESDFAFIRRQDDRSWALDFNTIYERPKSYFILNFLTKEDFRYKNLATNRYRLLGNYSTNTSLACAVALKARKTGPVAVFTTMKGSNGINGLADTMINFHNLNVNIVSKPIDNTSKKLTLLCRYIELHFGSEYRLSKLLKFGIGFHHGDLPQEIRREIEDAIQSGIIQVLLCTSTLAEGVNLPIRTLIVHTIRRYDGNRLSPINNRNIKNIIGRVGRAGKETKGRIIVVNDNERNILENVFREQNMEPAKGALFKLVDIINTAINDFEIELNNDLLEAQDNSFLATLDRIDIALIEIMPMEMLNEGVEQFVDELVEKTLAYQFCSTIELQQRIKQIFNLRINYFHDTVPVEQRIGVKNSGSSPRFWSLVRDIEIDKNPIWRELDEVFSEEWMDEIIGSILDLTVMQLENESFIIRKVIESWMSGCTYYEIAEVINEDIETALKILSKDIGYSLLEALNRLIVLVSEIHEDMQVSEIAMNWGNLLQYGLGSLQQLDLFNFGASDRLAVWSISRFIEINDISYRGAELIQEIRIQSSSLIAFLSNDSRVPQLSINRIRAEIGF
ncbi:DEAD/DEAH box helicase [Salinispira pacifica]|uniref:DEAD/DEAH box helicase n=1 Tax=Salinispira pacifica TaxID=1307761 RepID=V5WKA2_9SPIO|nr:DEAD/DEAH box helicase [Salinispira pacifica]AHC15999.1 hypothetical protein L21SP2_2647 [Salinispira pacifica]